jgi:hypothetical protein
MKILIVDGDDTLLSILAGELESRGFEVVPMHLGDGDCRSAKRKARLNSFFPNYRFIPCPEIKDGAQLLSAIHRINPFQGTAMMTSEPKDAPRKLRSPCSTSRCCGSRSGSSNCCISHDSRT